MRVTFVLPFTSVEGGSRVVAVYAEKLAQRGHDVLVVSCRRRPQRLKHRIKDWMLRAANGRFRARRLPTHFDHMPHLHRQVRGAGPIRARDLPDADVIVATWWETAEWVSVLPPSKGARVHLIQHDERIFSTDPQKRQRAGATWKLPGFSRVVVAGWLRELGLREFGVESTLVNNAVDTTLFTAPPRTRNPQPTFGLMYHERDFKGTDISLRAFEIARERVPSLRLKAFGPEPELQHLPLPPGTPLQVLPTQPKIAEFYRSCDAYLFGSRCEGFGLPILEAMACRTPVIGTPTGAAPELIAEGGGMLVAMEDPASMADAIVEMATMPLERWESMSLAAFATAQRHCWERATDDFEAVLYQAAGLRPSPQRSAHPLVPPGESAVAAPVAVGS